jgi:hypothetical protein
LKHVEIETVTCGLTVKRASGGKRIQGRIERKRSWRGREVGEGEKLERRSGRGGRLEEIESDQILSLGCPREGSL